MVKMNKNEKSIIELPYLKPSMMFMNGKAGKEFEAVGATVVSARFETKKQTYPICSNVEKIYDVPIDISPGKMGTKVGIEIPLSMLIDIYKESAGRRKYRGIPFSSNSDYDKMYYEIQNYLANFVSAMNLDVNLVKLTPIWVKELIVRTKENIILKFKLENVSKHRMYKHAIYKMLLMHVAYPWSGFVDAETLHIDKLKDMGGNLCGGTCSMIPITLDEKKVHGWGCSES
jgi:hypothetical protein